MLLQLFQVHEEHVRTVLLAHLEAYVEHFTPEQLRTVILPQVRDRRRLGIRELGGRGVGTAGADQRGWKRLWLSEGSTGGPEAAIRLKLKLPGGPIRKGQSVN